MGRGPVDKIPVVSLVQRSDKVTSTVFRVELSGDSESHESLTATCWSNVNRILVERFK